MRREISSLPGQYHLSVDQALESAKEAASLGIPAVLLFGLPEYKDAEGSSAWGHEQPRATGHAVYQEGVARAGW